MRQTFQGYYRPSEEEFRVLWDECLFILDANVLLNLYRYSTETRKKLVEVLKQVSSRLWIPHQVGFEYQRNRLDVISKQRNAYGEIDKLLQDARNQLDTGLKAYSKHPLISTEKVITEINAAFEKQLKEIRKMQDQHPDLWEKDDIRDTIGKLLDGKVGQPYREDRLNQIYKEGEERYSKFIPPGYRDVKTKTGNERFGDLILWFQIIDKLVHDKLPAIVITDDVKEDWWWRHDGKIVGPKPELVEEIRAKAGVSFYMYRSDQFMEYARAYLRQKVDQGAIDEVRALRTKDEALRRYTKEIRSSTDRMMQMQIDMEMIDRELRKLDDEGTALRNQDKAVRGGMDTNFTEEERAGKIFSILRSLTELELRQRELAAIRREVRHRWMREDRRVREQAARLNLSHGLSADMESGDQERTPDAGG